MTISSLNQMINEIHRMDLLLKAKLINDAAITGNSPQKDTEHSSLENDNIMSNFNLTEEITKLKSTITKKFKQIKEEAEPTRLDCLKNEFNLNFTETETVLLCLLSHIDSKYEKIFSALNGDETKKLPTVDLVLNLFYETLEDRLNAFDIFSKQSALFNNNILEFADSENTKNIPFPSRQIKLNDRVAMFLLGGKYMDDSLSSFAELIRPAERHILTHNKDKAAFIGNLIASPKKEPGESNLLFFFHGPEGAGKRETAMYACGNAGMPLLMLDMKSASETNKDIEHILIAVSLESRLQNAAVYYRDAGFVFQSDHANAYTKQCLVRSIQDISRAVFIDGEEETELPVEFNGREIHTIRFGIPSYEERKAIWDLCIDGCYSFSGDADIDTLAANFKLTGGQIRNAIAAAHSLSKANPNGSGTINMDNLNHACRAVSNQKLKTLAMKIVPKYKRKDIILPEDELAQLDEIINHVKHMPKVYDEWGFGSKHSLGKGLNILFSGPSGTGKTMTAEIISNELHLDMYKIDLASIVSKYIGETEKNLSAIFKEAEASNAILFFDEADALFGKRTMVSDAHDRYANIEVGYLLQEMEEYSGIVILATNMKKNMDDAFARRMRFIVEFPFPDAGYRERIWRNIFPKDAPLGDIDFGFIARSFDFSGGNIKNIALAAAFYAAKNAGVITMNDILLATKSEYKKTGKPYKKRDFEENIF